MVEADGVADDFGRKPISAVDWRYGVHRFSLPDTVLSVIQTLRNPAGPGDPTDFRGRILSLVVNQVVFVALAYSLLQLYFLRKLKWPELKRQTRVRLRDQMMRTDTWRRSRRASPTERSSGPVSRRETA